jgi:hypothetical protein
MAILTIDFLNKFEKILEIKKVYIYIFTYRMIVIQILYNFIIV